jgi:transcriptional regulator with XRE-family HTH domain
MTIFKIALGDVLRETRLKKNLTLRYLSDSVPIALGYLSEVERGHKEISSELLEGLADKLGVDTYELVIQAGLVMAGHTIPDTIDLLEESVLS